MPPLLTTPAHESQSVCATCGTTLVRTGKPITFGDVPATPATMVTLKKDLTTRIRGHRPFRGWIPSILVTICPTCDGFTPRVVTATAAEPEVTQIREAYLERLAREEAEREAREAKDDADNT